MPQTQARPHKATGKPTPAPPTPSPPLAKAPPRDVKSSPKPRSSAPLRRGSVAEDSSTSSSNSKIAATLLKSSAPATLPAHQAYLLLMERLHARIASPPASNDPAATNQSTATPGLHILQTILARTAPLARSTEEAAAAVLASQPISALATGKPARALLRAAVLMQCEAALRHALGRGRLDAAMRPFAAEGRLVPPEYVRAGVACEALDAMEEARALEARAMALLVRLVAAVRGGPAEGSAPRDAERVAALADTWLLRASTLNPKLAQPRGSEALGDLVLRVLAFARRWLTTAVPKAAVNASKA